MKLLRLCLWILAASLGGMQAWVSRFSMNPDGISYLDLGDAVWRGDWHLALNTYWSPLYPSVLGVIINTLKPSPYWEFPLVHLTNFGIYLCALVAFDLFLREFMKLRRQAQTDPSLPEWTWLTIGYLLFISSSLLLITTTVITSDMCVAGCVYLTAALLLRIHHYPDRRANFIFLGAVLGFAYLSKTAMFPLAFVFLGVATFIGRNLRQPNRKAILAWLIFFIIAAPLVLALSFTRHRVTFGDSGKLNYAWEVNGVPKYIHWQGEPGGNGVPTHPTRRLLDEPAVYEFATPIPTSYPPWYDPSYWYDGVSTHVNLSRQLVLLKYWIKFCFDQFAYLCGGFFALASILLLANRRSWSPTSMLRSSWFFLVPSLAALSMYSFVFVAPRYVAPFVVLLWLGILSGLSRIGPPIKWLDPLALVLAVLIVYHATPLPLSETVSNFVLRIPQPPPNQIQVASSLAGMGVQPGDKVASIGETVYNYWYRLAHVQVVAEVPGGSHGAVAFWNASPERKAQVLELLMNTGARVVVANQVPAGTNLPEWQRVANTDTFVYFPSR